MTLNELYKLDSKILGSMVLPCLSHSGILRGREWHEDVLRPNILLQCGQFGTLHTTPESFKNELEMWSKMRCSVWHDILNTTVQEYNLIHNYERFEELEETRTGTGTSTGNSTTSVGSNSDVTSTATVSTSAYNSAQFEPKDRTTGSVENHAETDTTDKSEITSTSSDTFKRKSKIYGNVGVTTAQEMLEAERKLVQLNIVQFIIDDFKKYFCILLY